MSWTAYQVSFRLLSPLHVGRRKVGNLQQTRAYVTGRNFWGALVSRVVREVGGNDYERVGNSVDSQLAFTYFYPSTESDTINLWPWSADGKENEEFVWAFLGSYTSTAIENRRNAELGSLHETEYIAPYTRDSKQVYLIGYIFEKSLSIERNMMPDWQNALHKLQVGGERSYGWGKLQLVHCIKQVMDKEHLGYRFILDGERPLLEAQMDTSLLAHTLVGIDQDLREGLIEPLVGRETTAQTEFGKKLSTAVICWSPGGKVKNGEVFKIQNKGIWEAVNSTYPRI